MANNESVLAINNSHHNHSKSGLLGGPISKWTNIIKGWQNRYLVLDQAAQTLYYFTSMDTYMHGECRGAVKLRGSVIGIDDDDDCMFIITTDDKSFHFQAKDPEERERWIHAIQKAADSHRFLPEAIVQMSGSGGESKQLVELGGYLDLLKSHMLNLEVRVNNTSGEERSNALVVLKNTKKFIESVEYAKILLQLQSDQKPQDVVDANSDSVSENAQRSEQSSLENSAVIDLLHAPIPVTSYSSSDEEEGGDSFFDALEDQTSVQSDCGAPNEPTNSKSTCPPSGSIFKHPVEVYDACYENNDEAEDEASQVDCSIFTHLLSQVKLGMDLTRVTLPTFILERRSFLEMIADFLAHPDLFTSITSGTTPLSRFQNVIRWYLSAFHAGRKSVVAKKPYNPILGEIFRCYYKIPSIHSKPESNNINLNDGPVPWASSGSDVTFIAEQVSHHPPVSAYYAECVDRNIEIEGWIWTKSRFLGLSVGVNMVGVTILRLLDYNEEYTMTFPSAYGRSIFSIPWFELGGKVNIECKQTGFCFECEFLTKPFYGGEKHCISGSIKSPAGKTLYDVEGKWNERMLISSSSDSENKSVLFDVASSTIIDKQVKSIKDQEWNESRRLWKDVTFHLKHGHVDRATDAKHFLEDRQRKDAALRAETNDKWIPKHFKATSSQPASEWVYVDRLSTRRSKQKN